MRFLLFFLLVSLLGFSQNKSSISEYECNYIIKFQKDTLNSTLINEEILSLLISENISLSKSTQKVIYDSLVSAEFDKSIHEAKGGRPIIDLSRIPTVKFKQEVYKNGDNLTGFNELLKTVYEYPITDKIKWNIKGETKEIQKYLCRKAVGYYNNREYVAWYAPKIPISEGPHVFKGLPGLIFEVYDTKNLYSFKLVGLKKVSKPIVLPISQIKTNYPKFARARMNFLKDPNGVFESQSRFKIPQKDRERLENMHKSNNNFID